MNLFRVHADEAGETHLTRLRLPPRGGDGGPRRLGIGEAAIMPSATNGSGKDHFSSMVKNGLPPFALDPGYSDSITSGTKR